MVEPRVFELKIRVIATFNAGNKEICADLPHLHQSHWEIVGWQPGNPGSSALGSFTIPLFPPGSEQYATAKVYYDALDSLQRVEAYAGGRLMFAGVITEIRKRYGADSVLELRGHSDLVLANLSKPFPGEVFSLTYGSTSTLQASYRQARNYFGTNEIGWVDDMSLFSSGNYTSSNLPTFTAGTWTGTTDDGFNVVSCATGSRATLIAKQGAVAGDNRDAQFIEVTGRLKPSAATANAGGFGIGFSSSSANCSNCTVAYVTAKQNVGSNWSLDVTQANYVAGVLSTTVVKSNALTVFDDGNGAISFTISYLATLENWDAVVVNGKVVISNPDVTLGHSTDYPTAYPFLLFGTPDSGSASVFMTNMVHMTRYTDDAHPGTAAFKSGTIGTPSQSLMWNSDAGPTFLEAWSRAATREGWTWRYTPTPYVVGTRTIGTIDMAPDPGTDRGNNQSVVFSRALGNLVSLELTANADQFTSATAGAAISGTDGGGLAYGRDVNSLTTYGAFEDQTLTLTAATFAEQKRAALQIVSNKVNLGSAGSKTAVVLRDPQTADVWRELDKVMIHDPELGINYLVARVIAYTFDEGSATQTLMLDQFSIDNPTLLNKRLQTGVWQVAAKFGNR